MCSRLLAKKWREGRSGNRKKKILQKIQVKGNNYNKAQKFWSKNLIGDLCPLLALGSLTASWVWIWGEELYLVLPAECCLVCVAFTSHTRFPNRAKRPKASGTHYGGSIQGGASEMIGQAWRESPGVTHPALLSSCLHSAHTRREGTPTHLPRGPKETSLRGFSSLQKSLPLLFYADFIL